MTTRRSLSRSAFAFACTSFGTGILNTIFSFYYVKVFLNMYNIEEAWFHRAQLMYMVWNAVNDPLFGYCQDNCKMTIIRSRRHSILFGAPLLAVTFLLPWFPWADYTNTHLTWLSGIHLLVSLCLYDTLYTYVVLAQCCLLTELSLDVPGRLQRIRYSQTAGILGSSCVLISERISAKLENIAAFQAFCVGLAFVACVCMMYTGLYADTERELEEKRRDCSPSEDDGFTEHSVCRLMWQIVSQVNFVSFAAVNFLSVVHRTFVVSFGSILMDHLVSDDDISPFIRSCLYGSIFILPKLCIVLFMPTIRKYGYYRVMNTVFVVMCLQGCVMYLLGMSSWMYAAFFVSESLFAMAVPDLQGVALSDIIDYDQRLYRRRYPISSMVFGVNALFTKPAQSVAPMVVVNLLNRFGYQQLKEGKLRDRQPLLNMMFFLSCFTPVLVGSLQLVLWRFYEIRSSHLAHERIGDDCKGVSSKSDLSAHTVQI